ncbi:hypothetical protein cypCar_00017454, partial [Cyprinus carpio]
MLGEGGFGYVYEGKRLEIVVEQNLIPSGTSEYCPPEYYVDKQYHRKPTIVWSLGMLLFLLVKDRADWLQRLVE